LAVSFHWCFDGFLLVIVSRISVGWIVRIGHRALGIFEEGKRLKGKGKSGRIITNAP
jgi:hypothetical protein